MMLRIASKGGADNETNANKLCLMSKCPLYLLSVLKQSKVAGKMKLFIEHLIVVISIASYLCKSKSKVTIKFCYDDEIYLFL